MNPFDFVNAINKTKEDLLKEPEAEKHYPSYMVNKALSYFPDTILYANEINQYHHLDSKLQFHFFLNSIRPARRFAKWVKKQNDNDLTAVMEYYGYSPEKARSALSILSSDQLITIKQKLEKGGQI
jgi:Bacteriophage clamp loader A subunit